MASILGDAGRAALKAFLASLLVLAPGVSAAPNLNRAVAVGIAALMASLAAGFAAVQVFVPQLSFRAWIPDPWGPMLDSFVHAFLGAFITGVIGILNMPDLTAWKSLVMAVVVGAINAGLRAVQGVFTAGESPSPRSGLTAAAHPAAANSTTVRRVLLPA